jgi:hypothetical protein
MSKPTLSEAGRTLGREGAKAYVEKFDAVARMRISRRAARTLKEKFGDDVFAKIRRGERLVPIAEMESV